MTREILRLYLWPALFLVLTGANVKAQDVPFSQFYYNNIYLNPALAGNGKKDYRLTSAYKNQWKSISDPFKSAAVVYDMPVYSSTVEKKFFGVGAGYFNDQAGSTSLKLNLFSLAVAYHLQIDRYQKVAGGILANYGLRSIDFSGVKWENQHNGNNYDPSLPSGEQGLSERYNYWDAGAGIHWSMSDVNEGFGMEAGLAVYHINHPAQSFIDRDNDRLSRKWQFYSAGEIEYSTYALLPRIIISGQGGTYSFTAGSLVKLKTNDQPESKYTDYNILSHLYLGTFYRFKDAVIFNITYDYQHLITIGLSYDITASDLNEFNRGKGGWEIVLIYDGSFLQESRIKVRNKAPGKQEKNAPRKL